MTQDQAEYITDAPFKGFQKPSQNYSKLPHDLIESLPEIDSLAELKVVLYILRHTWGFSEYDKPKKMTTDEFANGRKRKDGSRMDGGTGLVANSIRSGLEKAVEHGFITVDIDESDAARIEKWYCLNMSDDSNLESRSANIDHLPSKVAHRTEKETIERKEPSDISQTDEEQGHYSTAYARGEQERPDKVSEWLKMANMPGLKEQARLDALLSAFGEAFIVNTETSEWKKLAKHAISEQKLRGYDPQVFIEWVKRQDGYPKFWSCKRMLTEYPRAFVQDTGKVEQSPHEKGKGFYA
jgi:hypothetical protein